MNIKIKLLPGGTVPTRGSREAAGYDIYAAEDKTLEPLSIEKIRTGICIEMPPGYFGQIYGRSGLAAKRGLLSVAGTIDADYHSEISVVLFNTSNETQKICKGNRIAQIVFHKHQTAEWENVEELTETNRGGFGSTGI